MTDDGERMRLVRALEPLPTAAGGVAIVMATAGVPPAMALLSTGDVRVDDDRVSVVTYRGSSVSQRLGGSFTLMVPASDVALRVEVVDAVVRSEGNVELVEGRLVGIRPTAEPPWLLEMSFRPERSDNPSIAGFVDYWALVRAWLERGGTGTPPPTPL